MLFVKRPRCSAYHYAAHNVFLAISLISKSLFDAKACLMYEKFGMTSSLWMPEHFFHKMVGILCSYSFFWEFVAFAHQMPQIWGGVGCEADLTFELEGVENTLPKLLLLMDSFEFEDLKTPQPPQKLELPMWTLWLWTLQDLKPPRQLILWGNHECRAWGVSLHLAFRKKEDVKHEKH